MRGRGPINSAIGRKDEVLAPARDQTKRAFREARRSGFLSMPARNVTEFPPEIYHLEEHLDKDEKKWECVDLVKIDLSHNTISSISDEIAGLSTVSSIKLCQNALKTLPKGFFELVNLTYLDLSNNQLQSVSESLGALRNLKELGLASNKLQTLPQSIAHLCNLELLRIEENALSVLPESIGHLQRLHTLILHTNQLTTLPTSFGNLRNLQTLDMKKNRVDTMAGQLATLQSLKFLDLRQNKLVVFPQLPQSQVMDQVFLGFNVLSTIDEVSILRAKDSITVLDLRDNKLSILPTNIACLYKLKTLDVTNNDLVDLPPGLGYLKHLNHLVVDGNPLRAIRRAVSSASCESLKKYLRTRGGPPSGVDVLEEEVDELQLHRERERAMKAAASGEAPPRRLNRGADITSSAVYRDAASSGTLDLASHVLQSIPSEVCGGGAFHFSTTLVHLNLSKNRLTQLPSEIGELSSLVSLTVEDNQLREIDPSIAFLSRLQLVRIRKNQLTTDAINSFLTDDPQLISLKELDLRSNSLAQVPSNLRYLTSMETLLLSFNKIETLEEFPWYELINTSVLSISDNKLKSLGQVYLLPRLASISIENNTLSSIPCELGLCPDLRAIYINGNPQKTVRGGVIAKGSMEIIVYLKNKLPPNARLKPAPIPPTPQSQPSMQSNTLVAPRTPGVSVKRLEMYASTTSTNCIDGEDTEGENTRRNMPTRAIGSMKNRSGIVNTSRQTQNNDDDESSSIKDNSQLQELDEQIMHLEEQLQNHTLSAPKRYALKKELAVLRSTRIRQGRHKYAPNE